MDDIKHKKLMSKRSFKCTFKGCKNIPSIIIDHNGIICELCEKHFTWGIEECIK